MAREFVFGDYHRDKSPVGFSNGQFARNHVKVAGAAFRKAEVVRFLENANQCQLKNRPYGVRLARDAGNDHDPNAIAVWGFWTERRIFGSRKREVQLGFVPAKFAKPYAEAADNGGKIGALLKSGWIGDEGGISVDIAIYMEKPAARG